MFGRFPKWFKHTYRRWIFIADWLIWKEHLAEDWITNTRLFKFLKRRAKLIVGVNLAYMFIANKMKADTIEDLRQENKEYAVKESVLTSAAMNSNASMDTSWIPWAQVTYSNGRWKITGTNKAYDEAYGVREIDLLGYDNFQVFMEDVAMIYRAHDSLAIALREPIMVKEPHPRGKGELFVIKNARIEGNDTIVEMKIFELEKIKKAIKELE